MILLNSKYSRVVCKQEWVYDCKHKGHMSKGGPWGFLMNDFMDGMNDFMDGMVLEETRT